jgi:hypothetical protein
LTGSLLGETFPLRTLPSVVELELSSRDLVPATSFVLLRASPPSALSAPDPTPGFRTERVLFGAVDMLKLRSHGVKAFAVEGRKAELFHFGTTAKRCQT